LASTTFQNISVSTTQAGRHDRDRPIPKPPNSRQIYGLEWWLSPPNKPMQTKDYYTDLVYLNESHEEKFRRHYR